MKALFIYAHMDDETILSYGTMLKLAASGEVNILILCGKGRNVTADENIMLQQKRFLAFKENCSMFNYKLLPYKDITLKQSDVKEAMQTHIADQKPDIVFTHLKDDFHYEHRMVAEEVLLACRRVKNSTVKSLYMTASPAMMQAYCSGQDKVFMPNCFVDISPFIGQKAAALAKYSMELPADSNDIRSAESIISQNRQYGRQMNVGYCEAYSQVFSVI